MSDDLIPATWPILPQRDKYKPREELRVKLSQAGANNPASLEPTHPHTSTEDVAVRQAGGWEFLDHTADVQIHAWGSNIREAFGAAAAAMFAYMVEIDEVQSNLRRSVVASGHDWSSMLYTFLDECLYIFHTEALAMTRVVVENIDTESWTVLASVHGGLFDATRHGQGTEIKAITYSNMQVILPSDESSTEMPPDRRAQVYVIVDI